MFKELKQIIPEGTTIFEERTAVELVVTEERLVMMILFVTCFFFLIVKSKYFLLFVTLTDDFRLLDNLFCKFFPFANYFDEITNKLFL